MYVSEEVDGKRCNGAPNLKVNIYEDLYIHFAEITDALHW